VIKEHLFKFDGVVALVSLFKHDIEADEAKYILRTLRPIKIITSLTMPIGAGLFYISEALKRIMPEIINGRRKPFFTQM